MVDYYFEVEERKWIELAKIFDQKAYDGQFELETKTACAIAHKCSRDSGAVITRYELEVLRDTPFAVSPFVIHAPHRW